MALLDSRRDRIDRSNDLLSLGDSKTLSFCGDGGGPLPVLWKSGQLPLDKSDGSDSSAVISPSDGVAEGKMSADSSEQSGSTLKEHDYIGMAEVCSASLEKEKSHCDNESSEKLNLQETDLCLGLGLALRPSSNIEAAEKTVDFTFSQPKAVPKTMGDANMSTRHAFLEGASADLRSLQCAWSNVPLRTASADSMNVAKLSSHNQNIDFQSPQMIAPALQEVVGASRVGYCFQGGRVAMHPSTLKNGLKRGYSEAMSDMASFNMTPEVRAMSAMPVKNGDTDAKVLSKQPQNSFSASWASTRPSVTPPWQVGLEQSTSIPCGVSKGVSINGVEKSAADTTPPAFSGNCGLDNVAQNSSANEAPPKDCVVGWPPIRSYRKATLAKPTEMFVKVNMDGVTVGRKVDLNAHNSYESLLSALEEMFQPSNNAQGGSLVASGSCANDSKHLRLFSSSEFVLTYEDKDADWMLVGDVPWSMFATTVRRLRITRGLEAIGPGPRGSEKVK